MRIIFRHITGSRATEIDVVTLGAHRELILGRAPSSAVRFDPTADEMVGRQHARIMPTRGTSIELFLSDLDSRNGTFLNGLRVHAPTVIRSGDVLRLGESGPELEVLFDR